MVNNGRRCLKLRFEEFLRVKFRGMLLRMIFVRVGIEGIWCNIERFDRY